MAYVVVISFTVVVALIAKYCVSHSPKIDVKNDNNL